ncbi:hypothetical protein GOP47_0028573 [Adiantum capillus-veneris]|nr:hypothetical protein GOP47_0028573 [Adiantum capillus-veneris]
MQYRHVLNVLLAADIQYRHVYIALRAVLILPRVAPLHLIGACATIVEPTKPFDIGMPCKILHQEHPIAANAAKPSRHIAAETSSASPASVAKNIGSRSTNSQP